MYPVWIINMFESNSCPECRGAVTLDDINSIGVCWPAEFEAHLREPLALIIAKCRHCEQRIHFTTRCLKESLIDAMKELSERIETSPLGKTPLFGPGTASPQPSPSSNDVTNAPGKSSVRPSVRAGQNLNPPTQAEIKSFLARLKRMSFRPGSKDFDKLTGGNS